VTSFFSKLKGKRVTDQFAAWNQCSLQIDYKEKPFYPDVLKEMEKLKATPKWEKYSENQANFLCKSAIHLNKSSIFPKKPRGRA
jgi:hypothetical protein